MATDTTTSKTSMATSAPTRTFAIFELAEKIFLELPMRDLLIHQRTCKQWQSVMTESSKLQEAMFFKPATSRSLVIHEGRDTTLDTIILANPLFRDIERVYNDRTEKSLRPEASWRKQLLTQPPTAEVFASGYSRNQALPSRLITGSGVGVRMWELTRAFGKGRIQQLSFRGSYWWTALDWEERSAWEQVREAKTARFAGWWSWEGDGESESDEEELDVVDDDAI